MTNKEVKERGNFDPVARWYDRWSRWVFGDTLFKAKTSLLHLIPDNAEVLIPGAGSAAELDVLARQGFAGKVSICEASPKMIELSRQRWEKIAPKRFEVFFEFRGKEYGTRFKGNVISTSFFLDLFQGAALRHEWSRLDAHLPPGGLWLWADFVPPTGKGRLMHRLLLKTMYLFFWITCNIRAHRLESVAPLFEEHGYQKVVEKSWNKGFVQAIAWRKPIETPDSVHP